MDLFDFQHINLVPKKCIVDSRSECITTVKLGNFTFNLPVVPANMECVINDAICERLASAGYFYIHHRFNTDVVAFSKSMRQHNLPVSISVGVNEDAYVLLLNLKENNLIPDFITVDIAHGHSIKMEKIIKFIRQNLPPHVFIIAGNVSTPAAVKDLEAWGANAIKVGIGPGSACTTFNATGFGSRNIQAWTIKNCVESRTNQETVIIADGGIKDPGDIVKCVVLGAKMVMVGGMFSALIDSPGATVLGSDGNKYKEFWGSASAYQSGKQNRIEGTKKLLPMKHTTVLEEFTYLKECFQSAISYGGGNDLACLQDVSYSVLR